MNNSMVPVLYSTVQCPLLCLRDESNRILYSICRIRRYEYGTVLVFSVLYSTRTSTRPGVRGEIHAEIFN